MTADQLEAYQQAALVAGALDRVCTELVHAVSLVRSVGRLDVASSITAELDRLSELRDRAHAELAEAGSS